MRVIVFFFGVCFLSFLFLTGWEFSLIPYTWYQSLGLGLSGSNGRESKKGSGIEKFDGIDFAY